MFRGMRSYTCRFHSRPSFNPRGWCWASIASPTSNSVPYHIKFKLSSKTIPRVFLPFKQALENLQSSAVWLTRCPSFSTLRVKMRRRAPVSTADCCLDSCFCVSILVENKPPSLQLILSCHNKVLAIWTEMTIFTSMFMHQRLINVLFFSFIGGFSLYSFSRS